MGRVCSNCGTAITCGCQDRIATDGTPCCTKCVDKYNRERQVKTENVANVDYQAIHTQSMAPEIKSVSVKYNNYNS